MRREKSQYFCCSNCSILLLQQVRSAAQDRCTHLSSHRTEWVVRKLEVQWDPLENGCTTAIRVVQWCLYKEASRGGRRG